jgi:predicted transcriptional regulator
LLIHLASKGPLTLAHIRPRVDVNCKTLKEYISFLIEQNVVKENTVKKGQPMFAVTQRGITVLK